MNEKQRTRDIEIQSTVSEAIAQLHGFLQYDYEPKDKYGRAERTPQQQETYFRQMFSTSNISAAMIYMQIIARILFKNEEKKRNFIQKQIAILKKITDIGLTPSAQESLATGGKDTSVLKEEQFKFQPKMRINEEMAQVKQCIKNVLDLVRERKDLGDFG